MSDEQRTQSGRWGLFLGLLFLLFIGYPMSIGPFVFLEELELVDHREAFWMVLYAPIRLMYQMSPPAVQGLLEGYVKFWAYLAKWCA